MEKEIAKCVVVESDEKTNTATVEVQCLVCKRKYQLHLPLDGFLKWVSGELIQTALPDTSRMYRELLLSNTCNKCY